MPGGAVMPATVPAAVRPAVGVELLQASALLGRQNVEDSRFDALVFDRQFNHDLRLPRGERADLRFIELPVGRCRFDLLAHAVKAFMQRREDGAAGRHNLIDLRALRVGQV